MAIVFRDESGIEWSVSEIRRQAELKGRVREFLPEPYTTGWLLFQSGSERRRFAPIPEQWQSLPEGRLRHLLARAIAAPGVRRPSAIGRRLQDLFPDTDADATR